LGYKFGLPTSGRQNKMLKELILQTKVWINYQQINYENALNNNASLA